MRLCGHGCLGLFCATLGASAVACASSSDAVCDPVENVELTKTLTLASPQFYLSTPTTASSGTPDCQVKFDITWRWADASRADTDTSEPVLANYAQMLHVNSDTLYFPISGTASRTATIPYTWDLVDNDHNGTGQSTSQFYIRTGMGSAIARDSIYITAFIYYR